MPGFVFQRHEGDAAGRTRPLLGDDQAGDADVLARCHIPQALCLHVAIAIQAVPDQEHRVPLQRQPDVLVVGDDILAFGGFPEQRCCLETIHRGEQAAGLCDSGYRPACLVTMPFEGPQRTGRRKRLEFTPIEPGSLQQLLGARVRLHTAPPGNGPPGLLGQALHHPESEPQHRCTVVVRLERTIPVALVDVDAPNLDAMTTQVLNELRGRIESHGLAVQQRTGKGGRRMAFEPAGNVDEQRETGRMRFREAVLAEAFDLAKDLPCKLLAVAAPAHAVDQLVLEGPETAAPLPRRHRAPQAVGFARREARGRDRERHHLLLENRYAQGTLQDALDLLAGVIDGFLAIPPPQVGMHHVALDRAGTDDRDLDDEVVIASRLQPRQHRHLGARLDLEHTHRVALADHVVDDGVLRRHARERVLPAVEITYQLETASDRGQHPQAEHVDLQQTQVCEVVFLPLDHRAVFHRRILDRHEFRHRAVRDDETADVLRQVPREADQFPDEVE